MLNEFNRIVNNSRLATAKQLWFPNPRKQFAEFTQPVPQQPLKVDRATVVPFLQFPRDSDRPAWQRSQAIEAIQYYSETILQQNPIDLHPVQLKLKEIAPAEQVQSDGSAIFRSSKKNASLPSAWVRKRKQNSGRINGMNQRKCPKSSTYKLGTFSVNQEVYQYHALASTKVGSLSRLVGVIPVLPPTTRNLFSDSCPPG